MDNMNHTVGTVNVQVLPGKRGIPFKNPNDVNFDVKYPKDYKGPRLMPEGVVTISKESAEQFTKLGIGKVVEQTETVADEVPVAESGTAAEEPAADAQEPQTEVKQKKGKAKQ